MKKYGLIMFLLMEITVFAACGSSKETGNDSVDESKPVQTEEAKQEERNQETTIPEETTPETVTPELSAAEQAVQGTSWSVALESTFDYRCYDALYVDENTALSVGYGGVIKYLNSSDKTWMDAENQSMCRFAVDIINNTICYTCGNSGEVTKSEDGGKTFVQKAKFGRTEPDQCAMMDFIDENTGIIAAKKDFAITKDGAESWNEITIPTSAEIIYIFMVSADKFYYIDTDLTLNVTEDGGKTWTSGSMNLPEDVDYIPLRKNLEIVVDGEDAYTVYCVQKSTGFLKSYSTTDNFATYTENAVPELKVRASYLHMRGNNLTIYNNTKRELTVLVKNAE